MDGVVPTARTSSVVSYAALALAAVGIYFLYAASSGSYQSMAIASLFISAMCLVAVTRAWGRDLLQGPVLYLVLFLIFHLGIVWTLGFVGDDAVRQVSPTAFLWIRTGYFPTAVTLACVGAIVYSFVCTVLPRKPLVAPTQPPTGLPRDRRMAVSLGTTGLLLEMIGLGLVFSSVVRAGGVSLLFGGYLKFLEAAQPSPLAYGIWAIGVGASLSQLGSRTTRKSGLTIFLLFALVMFPLGLRGSVLFPAAALLATRAALGQRLRPVYLGPGILAVLSLSSIVRTTRIAGPSGGGDWYLGPISTITELGFSLRPTVEVLRWHDLGFPQTWFVSLVAVPIRLVERATNWRGGPPAVDDRLFNVKVSELAGPIGGSPVAEGYDAAGLLGTVVVMAIIALVICVISRQNTRGAMQVAMFPVVLLPLLIAVRNSFTPVIVQVIIGGTLVLMTRKLSASQAGQDRKSPPQEDTLLAR